MHQVPWNYGSLGQCGRCLHYVATCEKEGLSVRVLTHLNVEDQITLYLLISWRDVTLWFLPGIKCRSNILHISEHGVPPQCIAILAVKLNFLLHIIWEIFPKVASLQPILGFHFPKYVNSCSSNYEVPTKRRRAPWKSYLTRSNPLIVWGKPL